MELVTWNGRHFVGMHASERPKGGACRRGACRTRYHSIHWVSRYQFIGRHDRPATQLPAGFAHLVQWSYCTLVIACLQGSNHADLMQAHQSALRKGSCWAPMPPTTMHSSPQTSHLEVRQSVVSQLQRVAPPNKVAVGEDGDGIRWRWRSVWWCARLVACCSHDLDDDAGHPLLKVEVIEAAHR